MEKKNRTMKLLLVFSALLIVILGFNNISLSLKYGHCHDNLSLINEDLNSIKDILNASEFSIDNPMLKNDFIRENYHGKQVINLQLITIVIDSSGAVHHISH